MKFQPIADYYQKTLDGAMLDIASGAFDYNTVLKRVVSEMTNSGLRSVDYASGWSNRVPVAARRALMTGFNQVVAKVNEDNAAELETDMYEISWHSGYRPEHWWGGKWYTHDQLVSVCGLGTVAGLCGANCYHDYSPVIPGISEPTYTQEQLNEMNAKEREKHDFRGKEYNMYEATQRQRKLETAMRAQRQKIKLLQDGGADEDDIITARAKYRVMSKEYTDFSKAIGLPQQRERVNIDGLGNIGVGKWKIDLSNKDFNDILYMKGKMSNVDVRKWYIAHNKSIPDLIDKSKTIEEQARQAFELRNKFKQQARDLMEDTVSRKKLDKEEPLITFEQLIKRKMKKYNISRQEALHDIIKTATKTRKSINKQLGVDE